MMRVLALSKPLGSLKAIQTYLSLAKRLSGRPVENGCAFLGMAVIKCLQILVCWISNRLKGGQAFVTMKSDTPGIVTASADKAVRKEIE
eukprot:14796559-Ditylum_brightwellii.AAC.1